jgi:3-methyladenine DNA glycosylase Tag
MKEPIKIVPKDSSDYLRVMTKAVFQAGFNWAVIENKWSGFEEAFDNFDPYKVATYDAAKISALQQDARIVRNKTKINATIHNAQTMVDKMHDHGDFKTYLSSIGDFEAVVKELRKSFKWLGDFGAYYFLWVVGEPVPSYHEWCASRGVKPMDIES